MAADRVPAAAAAAAACLLLGACAAPPAGPGPTEPDPPSAVPPAPSPLGSVMEDRLSATGATYARYSAAGSPEEVVDRYLTVLADEGWSVVDEEPERWGGFGAVRAGAALDREDGYLSVIAHHPAATASSAATSTVVEVCTGRDAAAVNLCDLLSDRSARHP